MTMHLIVMGVAGCGKSSLAARVAQAERLPLLEGDEHHSPANRAKMSQGVPLDDADRAGWLATLADLLRAHPQGAVLSCSALKRSYREQLRGAAPGLRFAFLEIDREAALARVRSRESSHFFGAGLVDSQFEALESPVGEAGVLRLDALRPLERLQAEVSAWLASGRPRDEESA